MRDSCLSFLIEKKVCGHHTIGTDKRGQPLPEGFPQFEFEKIDEKDLYLFEKHGQRTDPPVLYAKAIQQTIAVFDEMAKADPHLFVKRNCQAKWKVRI